MAACKQKVHISQLADVIIVSKVYRLYAWSKPKGLEGRLSSQSEAVTDGSRPSYVRPRYDRSCYVHPRYDRPWFRLDMVNIRG